MSEIEKLAKIIKNNQGAVAYIDNDNWHLDKPVPDDIDDFTEDEADKWFDSCTLADSSEFKELGSNNYGRGLLDAMAYIFGVTVENV